MKRVEAYIKQHRLTEVMERLHAVEGLTGVSVHDIRGFGRTRGHDQPVRIVDNAIDGVPHVKIETFCADACCDRVVDAIVEGAHTGLRADGKVYVSEVVDAVRISTRERGEGAV